MAKIEQAIQAAPAGEVEKKKRQRRLGPDGQPLPSSLYIVFKVDREAADEKSVVNVVGITRNGAAALDLLESNPGAVYKKVTTGGR